MRTKTLLASVMLCFAASTQAQPREIGFGTVELTGMGSYSSGSAGKSDYVNLSLSPDVGLYLAPFVFVAPILVFGSNLSKTEYTDTFSGDKITYRGSYSTLDIGAKAGFLINYSQNLFRPLPYFSFGGGYSAQWSKYTGNPEDKEHGPFLSPAVGLKMKISESFLLDVEESFTHRNVYQTDENTFEWRFGFSGLI